MATLGMTQLEAVNLLLFSTGNPRVTALDPGGTSDAAEAEYILDLASEIVQVRGWPENTIQTKDYTPAATLINFTSLDATVIRVIPAGKDRGRHLGIKDDALYDFDNDVATFGTTDVTLTVVRELTWDNMPPTMKHLVLARAERLYRRRKMPDAVFDGFLAEEVAEAEIQASRHAPDLSSASINTQPLVINAGGRDNGQR